MDNAAILFSAATHRSETQVFRFSAELKDFVDGAQLQKALDETIEDFEAYRYIMKQGFFWSYLEETDIQPVVREENQPLCGPLYRKHKRNLLFEVSYYRQTINLEVFHVLSDGAGTLSFFEALLVRYLAVNLGIPLKDFQESITLPQSLSAGRDDSFIRNSSGKKTKKEKKVKAVRFRGFRYAQNRLKVIQVHLSTREFLELSKEHHGTVTAFLCACFMKSIWEELPRRKRRRPIVLSIPVNLRKYYASDSLRNFFNTILIPWNPEDEGVSLMELTPWVHKELKKRTSPELIDAGMNNFVAIEKNIMIKIVPLFLKNLFLKMAYLAGQKKYTAVVSNVGSLTLPDNISGEIKSFNVSVSTEKIQICVVSHGDVMSLGITTPFVNSEIQRRLVRCFTDRGLKAEISCNIPDWRDG